MSGYLLDTQVFLWMNAAPDRLGSAADLILDRSNQLFLSAASSWEIAIKFGLGKLPLPEPPARYVPSRMRLLGVERLPIEHSHALAIGGLPDHHRDPFDRMLVAQSHLERLPIITADPVLARYSDDLVLLT